MSTETPNVVIENPETRKRLGAVLYVIGVVAGLASFVLSGVPVPFDVDFWVAKITGAIGIISGAFGLGVTLPNIPKPEPVDPPETVTVKIGPRDDYSDGSE